MLLSDVVIENTENVSDTFVFTNVLLAILCILNVWILYLLYTKVLRKNDHCIVSDIDSKENRLSLPIGDDLTALPASDSQKEKPESMSGLYNQLSVDIKKRISHILKPGDESTMIETFKRGANAENFYELVRDRIVNRKNENILELSKILKIGFVKFSSQEGYTMIEPEIGEITNSKYHSVRFSENENGAISEVLLFGYKDSCGKVVHRAIVKVQ